PAGWCSRGKSAGASSPTDSSALYAGKMPALQQTGSARHAPRVHPERAYIYFTARVKEINVAREILRKGVRSANCAPRSPPEADRSGRPISGFLESGGFCIPGIPEQFAGLHRSSRVPGIPEATAGPKPELVG